MTTSAHEFRSHLCRAQRHLLAVRLLRVGVAAGGLGAVLASAFAASGTISRPEVALFAAASAVAALLAVLLFARPALARVARLGDRQAAHDENLLTTALERLDANPPAAMDALVVSRALAQISATPPHPPHVLPFAMAIVAATWLSAAALCLWTAGPSDQAGRTMASLDAMSRARRAGLAAKLDDAIDRATTGREEQLRRDLQALAKSVEIRDEAAYRKLIEKLKAEGLVLREVLPEALHIAGLDTAAAKAAQPATPIDPVASTAPKQNRSIRIYTPPATSAGASSAPPSEGTFDFDDAWNHARRAALQPASDASRTPHDRAVLDRYFKP